MAERSTVARPYAEAIFSVAQTSDSSLAEWDHWMQKLALAAKVPMLTSLLNNPANDTSRLQSVFNSVATSPNATADHVIALLLKNRRANLLPEISEQFSAFRAKAESVSEAKIFSPYPVVAGQLQQLLQLLEEKFARKLRPEVFIDESLIGGVRVVVGDEVLDTSVKAQLEKMKNELTA